MQSRRTFVNSLIGAGISAPVRRGDAFRHLFRAEEVAGAAIPPAVADDEAYWSEIQRAFDLDRTMINLNNGGCSPAPTHVLTVDEVDLFADRVIRAIKQGLA